MNVNAADTHLRNDSLLTLRALAQSQRFEAGWQLLSKQYVKTVGVPQNVVTFPRKRAA